MRAPAPDNTQEEGDGKGITLTALAPHFALPLSDAAKNLKVSLTALKRICRRLGLPRWPHRQIHSLDIEIADLEAKLWRKRRPQAELESDKARLALLAKKRRLIVRGVLAGVDNSVRSAIYLADVSNVDEDKLFDAAPALATALRDVKRRKKLRGHSLAGFVEAVQSNGELPAAVRAAVLGGGGGGKSGAAAAGASRARSGDDACDEGSENEDDEEGAGSSGSGIDEFGDEEYDGDNSGGNKKKALAWYSILVDDRTKEAATVRTRLRGGGGGGSSNVNSNSPSSSRSVSGISRRHRSSNSCSSNSSAASRELAEEDKDDKVVEISSTSIISLKRGGGGRKRRRNDESSALGTTVRAAAEPQQAALAAASAMSLQQQLLGNEDGEAEALGAALRPQVVTPPAQTRRLAPMDDKCRCKKSNYNSSNNKNNVLLAAAQTKAETTFSGRPRRSSLRSLFGSDKFNPGVTEGFAVTAVTAQGRSSFESSSNATLTLAETGPQQVSPFRQHNGKACPPPQVRRPCFCPLLPPPPPPQQQQQQPQRQLLNQHFSDNNVLDLRDAYDVPLLLSTVATHSLASDFSSSCSDSVDEMAFSAPSSSASSSSGESSSCSDPMEMAFSTYPASSGSSFEALPPPSLPALSHDFAASTSSEEGSLWDDVRVFGDDASVMMVAAADVSAAAAHRRMSLQQQMQLLQQHQQQLQQQLQQEHDEEEAAPLRGPCFCGPVAIPRLDGAPLAAALENYDLLEMQADTEEERQWKSVLASLVDFGTGVDSTTTVGSGLSAAAEAHIARAAAAAAYFGARPLHSFHAANSS